mmetsp:Transcript_8787/g.16580  ORF Transcript_8787/g.16580 Transcript_8787/m.16580 type:complete len:131 (-) Transcript_8787:178-570(-)
MSTLSPSSPSCVGFNTQFIKAEIDMPRGTTDETVDVSSKQSKHPEENVKDRSSSSTSSSFFPSMFWGGNIAEKVKLSRRKASMKVADDKTNSVKQVKTIVAKKPSLNVIPEKMNHEGVGGEKKATHAYKI